MHLSHSDFCNAINSGGKSFLFALRSMWKLLGESKVIGLGGSALEIDEGEDMGEIGGGTSTSMILVFSITGFEVLVSTISSKVSVSLLTSAFRGDSLIAG